MKTLKKENQTCRKHDKHDTRHLESEIKTSKNLNEQLKMTKTTEWPDDVNSKQSAPKGSKQHWATETQEGQNEYFPQEIFMLS